MRIFIEKNATKVILSPADIWALVKKHLEGGGCHLLVNGASMQVDPKLYRGSSRSNLDLEEDNEIIFYITPIKEIKPCQESGKSTKRES